MTMKISPLFALTLFSSFFNAEAIIGGGFADGNRYPYYTLLEIKSEVDRTEVIHYCGATLIHSDIILSSAFCDRGRIVATAKVNETSFIEGKTNPNRHSRIIENVVKHPNFTDVEIHDDLMIMKLHKPVKTVPLPQIDKCNSRPTTGSNRVYTVGLGVIDNVLKRDPEQLKSAPIDIVPHDVCKENLGGEELSEETHICAGRPGTGACSGDAGGPLVSQPQGTAETDLLWGIVSMSDEGRCGEENKPGIYTAIYPYLDWIYDTICAISKDPPDCCNDDGTHTCNTCEASPPIGGGGGFGVCLSGENKVVTEQRGEIAVSELQIGDKVLSSSDGNKYDTVYSFGHYQPDVMTQYLKVHLEENTIRPLEISYDHLVFVPSSSGNTMKPIPASLLKVGDEISMSSSSENTKATTRITKIDIVNRRGAYAPFTYSGQLIVNSGLLVSNFVTMQSNYDTLRFANNDWNTHLSYHWIAHLFETPHRMISKVFSSYKETYTNGLTKFWIDGPYQLAKSFLEISSPFQMMMVFVPFFVFFGTLRIMELMIFGDSSFVLVLVLTIATFLYHRRQTKKKV